MIELFKVLLSAGIIIGILLAAWGVEEFLIYWKRKSKGA